MSKYEPFAEWITERGDPVEDTLMNYGEIDIEIYDRVVSLTPTDIKRLMQCVERWEADERSESIGKQAEV